MLLEGKHSLAKGRAFHKDREAGRVNDALDKEHDLVGGGQVLAGKGLASKTYMGFRDRVCDLDAVKHREGGLWSEGP